MAHISELKAGDRLIFVDEEGFIKANGHGRPFTRGKEYKLIEIRKDGYATLTSDRGLSPGWKESLKFFEKVEEPMYNSYTE